MDENPEESFLLAILNELPQTVGDIPGFALNVILNHVLPSVLFSAAFFVLYVAGQKMSVKLYPPSAEERYKDAVAMLKKDSSADDDGSSEGSASSKREDALLRSQMSTCRCKRLARRCNVVHVAKALHSL